MPEIVFKGKEYVYNHHLTVPFRPLVTHAEKSVGAPDLGGNLVIHGDNLHALKSLLPRYAGKVDLVFIDPPYNTGNEGWCYSDGVNSPIMKEWLSTNPVDAEDMLRHDKWLCMMWPRLVLLRELLSEAGVIFVTIDDHESHRLEMMLDEIFGSDNNLGRIVARLNPKGRHLDKHFAKTHEYVLVFAKSAQHAAFNGAAKTEKMVAEYREQDGRGRYRLIELRNRNSAFNPGTRPNLYFPLYVRPDTGSVSVERDAFHVAEALPLDSRGEPTCWTWSVPKIRKDFLFLVGRKTSDGTWRVFRKDYLIAEDGEEATTKPKTVWLDAELNMDLARRTVTEILGSNSFDFPKPVALIQRLIEIVSNEDALVLDSFAGSGTTAHAVLKANAADGGSRRFILVEGEDYADRLTAERVRRVIQGYAWLGTQKETLLEQKITFTQFKKADEWLARIEAIKAREGFVEGDLVDQGTAKTKRFDRISVKLDEGVLRVEGEKKISERVDGLGGGFTYCTLGEPLDLDKLLSGESLPARSALGEWLFHTATGGALPPAPKKVPKWYLGEARDAHVWLVYEPVLAFLTSPEAALTLSLAKSFHDWGLEHDATRGERKRHLVFAPAKYLSNRQLGDYAIDYAPLPFALYREA
ncbi:site-specific DNA-methyltransferase [Silanimonas sp.]|uniref:site-specific DNA-methyltransferase n=1 Tax=Silanimonas sp. TaxID=1929290 RepID=UPI001BBAFE7C|nr:site-specific DNA-methyltransferase [Silanimonas sp.]MBS3895195.1 site-specific DNA-methyltransferase [Silanimonas sp.]MBS3924918.1 site-specific DNA-methyltransferase [Xanthomonadaceae bacterium]